MDVRGALKSQYHSSLAMLRQAIERCPDDVWLSGTHPRLYWRVAFHALFFAHFYLQPDCDSFEPWDGTRRDAMDIEGGPPVVEPCTRAEMLEYWAEVDAQIDPGVDRLDLDAPTCGFPWYQLPKLDHQVLNIRHIQEHCGQLACWLQPHGVDIDWQ